MQKCLYTTERWRIPQFGYIGPVRVLGIEVANDSGEDGVVEDGVVVGVHFLATGAFSHAC